MSENIAYLLVTASTILFACQFLFQKKYGESEGEGLRASVTLALLSSIVRIILVVVLYGVSGYSFTLYGFVCSFFAAVSYCCVILFSAGALKYANMAKYSVYMMLGGMVLPFAAGIAFFSEPLTFGKFAGLLLVAAATCFSNLKAGTKSRGAVKYYIGVFICNGMNGVISKFNQSSPDGLSASSLTLLTAALVGCHLRCLSGGKYCKVGKKAVVFIGSHCPSSGGTLRGCLRYRKFASAYLT